MLLQSSMNFITHFISSFSYLAVFTLMTLESALIPIPSEVTMPFAGFLSAQTHLNFWLIVFLGACGNLTGSLLSYVIGYYLEENIILSLISKYGKFLLITKDEYLRAVEWFKKYGNPIAFFSRLMPVIRTFISLPAGLAEMKLWKFSIYTFSGSLIWSFFLTWIGVYLGKNWNAWEPYFKKFQLLIIAVIVIAILWYINHKLKLVKFPH